MGDQRVNRDPVILGIPGCFRQIIQAVRNMRVLFGLALVAALAAGCTVQKRPVSPVEAIAPAVYRNPAAPKMTLITVINNRSGGGAHTALHVEGSQSVIFDPAGSFKHSKLVARDDVLYGMSPAFAHAFKSAHARKEFRVVSQEIPVTNAQAERALQLVLANGPVASAYCAHSTSGLLRQVPGFEGLKQGFYPIKLMEQIAQYPGVKTTELREDD